MTKVALIGGAGVAVCYATAPARLPGVEFAAIVDRDPATASRTLSLLGAATTADSLDVLLDLNPQSFDSVLIHGSIESRVELIERAASAGKHVLVASPLAESVDAAERVISTCRSAGVRLMVGHSSRFLPSRKAVKAALDSGKLGEPGLLRIHHWAASPEELDVRSIVMRQAVDGIDLAHWLFGGRPNRIFGFGRPGYAHVHLGFSNGGMALIDYATSLPDGDGYSSLSLIGSSGAAYADDHHNRNLLFAGGHPRAIDPGEGSLSLIAQLAEFVSSIDEERESTSPGNDGRAALQVAEAALASLESHRPLRLTGDHYEVD